MEKYLSVNETVHQKNRLKSFCSTLYTAPPSSLTEDIFQEFFGDTNLPKLDKIEQDKLGGLLLKEDCYIILKQCAKRKCSGSDGLSVEFYLQFWHLISEEMVESFNYAPLRGQINITQRQGISKVIPKKKKDKFYLKN